MAIKHDIEEAQEEIRVPLIPGQKKTSNPDEDGYGVDGQIGKNSNKGHEWMVDLTTFVAVCGSFEFGSCIGFSSPIQSSITEDLNLSIAEYSLFGSLLTFGSMIGAITSGPIADFIGRKGALRVATGICTAGSLAIYFAEGPLPLDIGRLAKGYGMGVYSYMVPVFIAEIAPKNLRGELQIRNSANMEGFSLDRINTMCRSDFGSFIIPESPRWLAKIGRQKEFEVALQRLRGKDVNISEEAAEIQDYIETLEKLPKVKLLDLFQRRYLNSVTIGVGLMVFQQFGGINGVCFYVSNIFKSAGFPSKLGTIIYACLQVVVTALGAFIIDSWKKAPSTGFCIRLGRRLSTNRFIILFQDL